MTDFDKSEHVSSKTLNRKLNAILFFQILQFVIIIAALLNYFGFIQILP